MTGYPYHRSQVFRICQDAYQRAGIRQPSKATDRVGAVHVLRHSGALARLPLRQSEERSKPTQT